MLKPRECRWQQQVSACDALVTRQKLHHVRRCKDLMVFLLQVSAAGSNQPNSIKAQVQHETIKPYQFLTILCSVPDVTRYTGKIGLIQ